LNLLKEASVGIKWLAIARLSKQAFQFITLIILARLLTPDDFGLMTTALVVIGLLNIFRDMGLSAAIIQRKLVTDELLSTLFWLSIAIGIIVTSSLIIVSPLIAGFYKTPKLALILQILSFSFLITSLTLLHQALLEKDLKFNLLSKIEIISTLIGAVVGIIMAINNFGVWSLVFQNLVNISIVSAILWFNKSFKPKLHFKFRDVQSIANYSINLAGFNVVNYFVRNSDYVLIQKFLGEKLLGFYNLAYRIMLYPLQNVTAVISRVMFPVYSRLQDDNEKFRDSYVELTNLIALITFPLMLWIVAVSDIFIISLFSKKWEAVIPLLIILAPVGMIQSVYSPAGLIYQTKGRTDWWFKWGIFTGVLFILAFLIGIKWGLIGVALGYLTANLITFYPGLAIPFRLIDLKVNVFIRSFSKTFLISLVMSAFIFCIKILTVDLIGQHIAFGLSLVLGFCIYLLLTFAFNRENGSRFIRFLKLSM